MDEHVEYIRQSIAGSGADLIGVDLYLVLYPVSSFLFCTGLVSASFRGGGGEIGREVVIDDGIKCG